MPSFVTAEEMQAAGAGDVPAYRTPAMPFASVRLRMDDGDCPAHLFKPLGAGPWPAVIFLMDGFGMRPKLMEMAQRLADGGYLVLLPDLFYRRGAYDPLDVPAMFASGNLRQAVGERLGPSPTNAMVTADAAAFVTFLRDHPDATGSGIGVVGYCMSGGMALAIAGTYSDDIAAAACFHAGLLVSGAADSPHLLAPSMKAEVYVGGAETDEWCSPAMVAQLDDVLSAERIEHRCEVYQGTCHGWTMRDSPLYDGPAAERHWRELLALFARTLSDTPRHP